MPAYHESHVPWAAATSRSKQRSSKLLSHMSNVALFGIVPREHRCSIRSSSAQLNISQQRKCNTCAKKLRVCSRVAVDERSGTDSPVQTTIQMCDDHMGATQAIMILPNIGAPPSEPSSKKSVRVPSEVCFPNKIGYTLDIRPASCSAKSSSHSNSCGGVHIHQGHMASQVYLV
jgi:hypothetical protein